MTPIPEPTIYDITDIPFFAWDPPSLAWVIIIAFAILTLLTLFSPFKKNIKNSNSIPPSFSVKQDVIAQLDEAILTLSEESISKASIRIKRFLDEKETAALSPFLQQLDKERYAPSNRDRVKELLLTLKKEISRVSV